MATADLLELSRWGAMWNAEVEQLNQASAIACISCTSVRPGDQEVNTEPLINRKTAYW